MPEKLRYDFELIRQSITARELAERFLHYDIREGRCRAEWRGGDNPTSVVFNESNGTFKDFGSDAHGDAIDLFAVAQGLSVVQAANYIGDKLNLREKETQKDEDRQAKPAQKPMPPQMPIQQEEQRVKPQKPSMPMPVLPVIKQAPGRKKIELLGNIDGIPMTREVPKNESDRLEYEGFVLKASYQYEDASGMPLYNIERWENADGRKEFRQNEAGSRRTLKNANIYQVLYHLPEVVKADRVFFVEGEKNADFLRQRGYCATTNSSGSQKSLTEDDYNYLMNKEVIVLADNDTTGRHHAEEIAKGLMINDASAKVKLIIPSTKPKGDIVDWLEDNHSNDDFEELISNEPYFQPNRVGEITKEMIEEARQLNHNYVFSNFVYDASGQDGRQKMVPRSFFEMYKDLKTRMLGYPMRLGDVCLFDKDKDTGAINKFHNARELFAWIDNKTNEYSGRVPQWCYNYTRNFISKDDFYQELMFKCTRFERITHTPEYPYQTDTFYAFNTMPEPTEDHRYFWDFIKFFNPTNEANRIMLAAFIMAPMWQKAIGDKPLWIIDSDEGRGVGKTTLATMVGILYSRNEAPSIFNINANDIDFHFDDVRKNLMSSEGRTKHIMLIDNLCSNFRTSNLAQLITSRVLTGRPPYGKGEETRPNNLTYAVTVNSAELDTDLTTRSFFVTISRPEKNFAGWKQGVLNYIRNYRFKIFADMIDILKKHKPFEDAKIISRFPEFEQEVLQACAATRENYTKTQDMLKTKKAAVNMDLEKYNDAMENIRNELCKILPSNISPSNCFCWIRAKVLRAWTNNTFKASELRDLAKNPQFNTNIFVYPPIFPEKSVRETERYRGSGIMWVGENIDLSASEHKIRTVFMVTQNFSGQAILVNTTFTWDSTAAEKIRGEYGRDC